MSERYQIVIRAGEHTFHFKTKTRVGEFWNFAEEMKEHTDWENKAILLDKQTKQVLEKVACPECSSKTQETFMEGEYLLSPNENGGIITAKTIYAINAHMDWKAFCFQI